MLRDRPAHHLALAVDVSRHCGGYEIRAARSMAWRLIDKLDERDTLSILTFGSSPRFILPRTVMDPKGKLVAQAALKGVEAKQDCDLFEGWAAAAEDCANAMKNDGSHHRVILAASGQSDALSPSVVELATHARNLEARNLPTTAIGLGRSIDTARLVALDDSTMLYSEVSTSEDHVSDALVYGCLELSPLTAFEVEFECRSKRDMEIEPLERLPGQKLQQRPRQARELRAGMKRQEIFRVTIPASTRSFPLPVSVKAKFATASGQDERVGHASATFAPSGKHAVEVHQERNVAFSSQVAARWQAALLHEVIDMLRNGATRSAEQLLANQYAQIENYCKGLPMSEEIMDMLKRSVRTIGL